MTSAWLANACLVGRLSLRLIEPDFGGDLPQHARCIYSYWSGYLKKPEWGQLQERIQSADGDFVKAHTSGHIVAEDLGGFIREVNPKTLIPIHTFEPARFCAARRTMAPTVWCDQPRPERHGTPAASSPRAMARKVFPAAASRRIR